MGKGIALCPVCSSSEVQNTFKVWARAIGHWEFDVYRGAVFVPNGTTLYFDQAGMDYAFCMVCNWEGDPDELEEADTGNPL